MARFDSDDDVRAAQRVGVGCSFVLRQIPCCDAPRSLSHTVFDNARNTSNLDAAQWWCRLSDEDSRSPTAREPCRKFGVGRRWVSLSADLAGGYSGLLLESLSVVSGQFVGIGPATRTVVDLRGLATLSAGLAGVSAGGGNVVDGFLSGPRSPLDTVFLSWPGTLRLWPRPTLCRAPRTAMGSRRRGRAGRCRGRCGSARLGQVC
jgi:hypothetical protein